MRAPIQARPRVRFSEGRVGVRTALPRPPQGGSGVSSDAPQFRWTFKTWVTRVPEDRRGQRAVDGTERTVTVIASNEDEAKRRIASALPALPPKEETDYGWVRATFERSWSLEADVVEVE